MKSLSPLLALLLLAPPLWGAEHSLSPQEKYAERSQIAEEWSFKTLPYHLEQDLKESFWNRWHLIGLAAGTGLTLGLHQADNNVRDRFSSNPRWEGADPVFNLVGNPIAMGVTTLLATTAFKLAKLPKATWVAGTMLEALFVTDALTFSLKFATQRERPDHSDTLSFPSSHASGSFALASVTEVTLGPLWGIPAYGLAGVIAFSRIDSNEHYLSDTAAGALLGTLVGLGTARFHKKQKPDFFILPTATQSGIMVNLARSF